MKQSWMVLSLALIAGSACPPVRASVPPNPYAAILNDCTKLPIDKYNLFKPARNDCYDDRLNKKIESEQGDPATRLLDTILLEGCSAIRWKNKGPGGGNGSLELSSFCFNQSLIYLRDFAAPQRESDLPAYEIGLILKACTSPSVKQPRDESMIRRKQACFERVIRKTGEELHDPNVKEIPKLCWSGIGTDRDRSQCAENALKLEYANLAQ